MLFYITIVAITNAFIRNDVSESADCGFVEDDVDITGGAGFVLSIVSLVATVIQVVAFSLGACGGKKVDDLLGFTEA